MTLPGGSNQIIAIKMSNGFINLINILIASLFNTSKIFVNPNNVNTWLTIIY